MSVAASWAQRMLRVWRGLPPRENIVAPSSTSPETPVRRALIAAHNAALPPPITSTSNLRLRSTMPCCLSRSHRNQDLRGDGIPRRDGLAAAIDGQRRENAAGRSTHQPISGRSLVAGLSDQPGRCQRREGAEQRDREAESQRETGRTHVSRNDLGQGCDHRAIVDAEVERQYQFYRQHLAERD